VPPLPLAPDTSPEAEAVRFALLRRMSPMDKARRVGTLTAAANHWALCGLRERFPEAAEQELLLRLAVLRLGEECVARAYGWRAGGSGP
jgi:hypothetical protein